MGTKTDKNSEKMHSFGVENLLKLAFLYKNTKKY